MASGDGVITQADIRREQCVKRLNEIRHSKIHANIKLVPEQEYVLNMVKRDKNVMLTGEGGSGKTVTLMAIIKYLSETMSLDQYAICASTGTAALHLQVGTTLHSVFKLIPGTESMSPEEHFKNHISCKPWVMKTHKRLKVILIDEVSMLKAIDLEKIDYICRNTSIDWNPRTREEKVKSYLPFGGKQIILCGDFSQLPPVFKSNDGPQQKRGKLLFESEAYANGDFQETKLATNHRQRTDVRMQYVLNCLRNGVINDFVMKTLGQLRIPLMYRELNGIDQVSCKLHCTNDNVDKYNMEQLQKLPFPEFVFEASDNAREGADYHLKSMRYPKELTLRVGAKVRLLKNMDLEMNLANGSPGVVTGVYNIPNKKDDRYRMKVRDMESMALEDMPYVRVRFWLAEGVSHEVDIATDSSEVKGSNNILASRVQFPLALTFATTIHSAQGQTHPCFELDLSNAFEAGQGYVGLSRGTNLNGIYLSGFDASRIKCNPLVTEFYKRFETQGTLQAARELEEKALSMGPYEVTLKKEFEHLRGTFKTDFEDIEESNRLADLKRRRDYGNDGTRNSKRSKTDADEDGDDDEDAPPMYLCVTGSKHITDKERFERCMGKLVDTYNGKLTGIVTGDKDGVEKMAADFAVSRGLVVLKQTLAKQPGKEPALKKASKRKRLVDNGAEIAIFNSKEHECKGTKEVLAVRDSQTAKKKLYTYNF